MTQLHHITQKTHNLTRSEHYSCIFLLFCLFVLLEDNANVCARGEKLFDIFNILSFLFNFKIPLLGNFKLVTVLIEVK